jgi:hypothetical protein
MTKDPVGHSAVLVGAALLGNRQRGHLRVWSIDQSTDLLVGKCIALPHTMKCLARERLDSDTEATCRSLIDRSRQSSPAVAQRRE